MIMASVNFADDFAVSGDVTVKAGEVYLVKCHARGGYPDPAVRVALGAQSGVIDESKDVVLEETVALAGQRKDNGDGTADYVKMYTFMPSIDDCGKFIKCEAVQKDSSGKILFNQGSSVTAKKIKVTFPPQPPVEPVGPFEYEAEQDMVQVDITFMSYPLPENNQAIWHISPNSEIGPEAMILQAGDSRGDKYEALALNKSSDGHAVTASLLIFNLEPQDATYYYVLHVKTDQGDTMYPFKLSSSGSGDRASSGGEGTHDDHSDEPEVQEGSVSTGTIAGIVLIVAGIIIVIGCVFWAKSNDKLCFNQTPKQQKVAAAAADDMEAGEALRGEDQENDNKTSRPRSDASGVD